MIYLCINLYKSVTKVGNYFQFCKKILIFFFKISQFSAIIVHFGHFFLGFLMLPIVLRVVEVRLTGLEPARLTTPDPKSDASTNSATGALALPA